MTAKNNLKKYSIATLKGLVGTFVPFGSLAVELFNTTIPEKRSERFEKLLMILASKEFNMNHEELERKFNSSEFADIFEEVSHQAIKALSDERLEYLASVAEHSLKQEKIDHLQLKRLLEILEKINDVEVVLLQSYEYKNRNNQDFRQKHSSVFDISKMDSEKASEHKVMLSNYKSNLINLGLIGRSDFLGDSQLSITKLGVMLLKRISLKNDKEMFIGKPFTPIDAIDFAFKKLDEREKEIKKELNDIKRAKQETNKAIGDIKREFRNMSRTTLHEFY